MNHSSRFRPSPPPPLLQTALTPYLTPRYYTLLLRIHSVYLITTSIPPLILPHRLLPNIFLLQTLNAVYNPVIHEVARFYAGMCIGLGYLVWLASSTRDVVIRKELGKCLVVICGIYCLIAVKSIVAGNEMTPTLLNFGILVWNLGLGLVYGAFVAYGGKRVFVLPFNEL